MPDKCASRPASSGNASKIPKVEGPRRSPNHATVAGSSLTIGRPAFRKSSTCCSLPGLASRRTFDFLPLLKQGDSFYKTVKPNRKNVLTGVNISIMPCATRCTSPFSYSQTCSTFRTTGHIATARASLGSLSLTYEAQTTPRGLASRGPCSFKHNPPCNRDRFGELAFFTVKLGSSNVTYHD